MTIDNTEQIKKLIANCGKDEFYMLQVIHRAKDGKTPYEPEGKKNLPADCEDLLYLFS